MDRSPPPGAVIEKIERRPDTLKALIRTILASIRRDMVPLFDRHPNFYVSVNIPPVILGSGQVLQIVEELELRPYLQQNRVRSDGAPSINFRRALGVGARTTIGDERRDR